MTYLIQDQIASSAQLSNRIAQAAAAEGVTGDPDQWTRDNRRKWAAAPGWDAAWASAQVTHPADSYDPGADESVITDAMILSQVQAMLP